MELIPVADELMCCKLSCTVTGEQPCKLDVYIPVQADTVVADKSPLTVKPVTVLMVALKVLPLLSLIVNVLALSYV